MYKKSKKLISVGILFMFVIVAILPSFTEVNTYANDPVKPVTNINGSFQCVYDWIFSQPIEVASAEIDNIFVDDEIFTPDNAEVNVFEDISSNEESVIRIQSVKHNKSSVKTDVSANKVIEEATEDETTKEVVEEPTEKKSDKTSKKNKVEKSQSKPKSGNKDKKTSKKDSDKIYDVLPLEASVIDAIIETCEKNDIPILNAIGIIDLESQFNVNAKAGSGCYGLCQLNPRYFPKNLSPEDNVRYGINYLASHYKTYKDWTKAYNAYNAGHVTGDTKYANKVFGLIEKWKKEFDKAGIEY